MNKKRSQVAHYVKCELLVARRPLTIFFLPSHLCPALAHPIRCDVCAFVVALVYFICFTLYDVAGLEICVLCAVIVYMKEEKKPTESEPKDTPTKSRAEFYLFYSVFRSIVSYALCVCFFISLLCSSSCLYFRFVSLVGTSFFLSSFRSSCSCCYLQCEKENLCGQNKFT